MQSFANKLVLISSLTVLFCGSCCVFQWWSLPLTEPFLVPPSHTVIVLIICWTFQMYSYFSAFTCSGVSWAIVHYKKFSWGQHVVSVFLCILLLWVTRCNPYSFIFIQSYVKASLVSCWSDMIRVWAGCLIREQTWKQEWLLRRVLH